MRRHVDIRHVAALPPRMGRSIVFASWRRRTLRVIFGSLGPHDLSRNGISIRLVQSLLQYLLVCPTLTQRPGRP